MIYTVSLWFPPGFRWFWRALRVTRQIPWWKWTWASRTAKWPSAVPVKVLPRKWWFRLSHSRSYVMLIFSCAVHPMPCRYVCLLYWKSFYISTWWRPQMVTFSALLAICAGNSPVPGEFPAQRPVTRSFDVLFDLRLNKRLSKQSWGWWLETL